MIDRPRILFRTRRTLSIECEGDCLDYSNSHQPFRTLYSLGFREPGFVNFSFPAAGNRPESP